MVGTAVYISTKNDSEEKPETTETPTPYQTPTSTPKPTPIKTLAPAPKATVLITPRPTARLLDDNDTFNFYLNQKQAIDLGNSIIQRYQNQIYQSESWITNIKAVLPYQYDHIITMTTPIIQDRQYLVVLLRSSISNHEELIRIRKIIIMALENNDAQTLLNTQDILSSQTDITVKLDQQINQLNSKLEIEIQNLSRIISG